MNPRTTERDSSVRVGAACGLIQPLRAEHREVQKPVTHIDPHDNPELQQAEEECDSARHAYAPKPCGTCITAMLMPVLYLGRVPKRQRARIRASRSWNLLSSPVVVPHNPFSSKNDSQ